MDSILEKLLPSTGRLDAASRSRLLNPGALPFLLPDSEEQCSVSVPLGTAFEPPHPISSFMVGLGTVTEVDSR